MYVCVCVHTYAYEHVCVNWCALCNMQVHANVNVGAREDVYITYVYDYVCVTWCARMLQCVCAWVCFCVFIYVYTYACT